MVFSFFCDNPFNLTTFYFTKLVVFKAYTNTFLNLIKHNIRNARTVVFYLANNFKTTGITLFYVYYT